MEELYGEDNLYYIGSCISTVVAAAAGGARRHAVDKGIPKNFKFNKHVYILWYPGYSPQCSSPLQLANLMHQTLVLKNDQTLVLRNDTRLTFHCIALCGSTCHRALSLQHLNVLLKAYIGIVRARGCLRVILDAHGLQRLAQHAGTGAIIEINMRDLNIIW